MPTGIYERKKRNNYPLYWEHGKHENILTSSGTKLKLPPLEILNWLFRYEGSTGKLFKIREASGKRCNPEREIGCESTGYLQVTIVDSNGLKKIFKVHQLVYYMATGSEPLQVIDHCDGNKLNNKFDNLRLTTVTVNNRNAKTNKKNTSGYTGVSLNKKSGKWHATVRISNKLNYIGSYDTPEEAYQARLEYVGRFNLHNLDECFSYRHTNIHNESDSNGGVVEDINQE